MTSNRRLIAAAFATLRASSRQRCPPPFRQVLAWQSRKSPETRFSSIRTNNIGTHRFTFSTLAEDIGPSSNDMSKTAAAKSGGGTSQDADHALLAAEWSKLLLARDAASTGSSARPVAPSVLEKAMQRTIPLLYGDDASTVPFVCRYRADVVAPLTTEQVHVVMEFAERHAAIQSLRERAVAALDGHYNSDKSSKSSSDAEYMEKRKRMLSTTVKSELEELYAPYKPPAKGSIAERIASSHPDIVELVDKFWSGEVEDGSDEIKRLEKILKDRSKADTAGSGVDGLSRKDCVIHLLGTHIAASPFVCDVLATMSRQRCVVETKKKGGSKKDGKGRSKYEHYYDFKSPAKFLRDHQVLAIRRGVAAKELSMTIAVPNADFVKNRMKRALLNHSVYAKNNRVAKAVVTLALDDAWSRLLKRRSAAAVWKEKVATAEQRGIAVFAENVASALMVPPQRIPTCVLALDPGHRAGIKIAMLNPRGELIEHEKSLSTIHFLGNKEDAAVEELSDLLRVMKGNEDGDGAVVVAVGNGHGSDEARRLIEAASSKSGIPIDNMIVNEAGASVWSVTEAAANEFKNKPPAALGAVSIGRRLQDPMNELVKIPPRSLGLGMYQHDLPEKELDKKLTAATIDKVAEVGVDANSACLELLRNVPGITKGKLAEGIVANRPISSREDLMEVKGLGPKAFENCAGFIKIRPEEGSDILDSTSVHPEAYSLARYFLKKLHCNLDEVPTIVSKKGIDDDALVKLINKGSKKYGVSTARAEIVLQLLANSEDPRLRSRSDKSSENLDGCLPLDRRLANSLEELKNACPVRNIIGTVRNIADFGVFIDFGSESNGLLHNSRMGPNGKGGLSVGKRIGVDILGCDVETKRVTLGRAGQGFDAITDFTSSKPIGKRANKNVGRSQSKKKPRSNPQTAPNAKRQRRYY